MATAMRRGQAMATAMRRGQARQGFRFAVVLSHTFSFSKPNSAGVLPLHTCSVDPSSQCKLDSVVVICTIHCGNFEKVFALSAFVLMFGGGLGGLGICSEFGGFVFWRSIHGREHLWDATTVFKQTDRHKNFLLTKLFYNVLLLFALIIRHGLC